jgi:hypothetical protein
MKKKESRFFSKNSKEWLESRGLVSCAHCGCIGYPVRKFWLKTREGRWFILYEKDLDRIGLGVFCEKCIKKLIDSAFPDGIAKRDVQRTSRERQKKEGASRLPGI